MPSILLKGVPADVHKRLKQRAAENRRSMAQEAITILEGTLRIIPPIRLPDKPLHSLKPISRATILRAIRAGRK